MSAPLESSRMYELDDSEGRPSRILGFRRYRERPEPSIGSAESDAGLLWRGSSALRSRSNGRGAAMPKVPNESPALAGWR